MYNADARTRAAPEDIPARFTILAASADSLLARIAAQGVPTELPAARVALTLPRARLFNEALFASVEASAASVYKPVNSACIARLTLRHRYRVRRLNGEGRAYASKTPADGKQR